MRENWRRREDYEAHSAILTIRSELQDIRAQQLTAQSERQAVMGEVQTLRHSLSDSRLAVLLKVIEVEEKKAARKEALRNRLVGTVILAPLVIGIAWLGRHIEALGAWFFDFIGKQ